MKSNSGMKAVVIVTIVIGMIIVFLAAPLGNVLADKFLMTVGGMSTERFLIVEKGIITSIHIIGTLIALFGGALILRSRNK